MAVVATFGEVVVGLTIAIGLARPFLSGTSSSGLKSSVELVSRAGFIKTVVYFVLFVLARSWLALVDKYAPEPYLDEVFHIPQAQTYCEGRFWDWDDKITTPPGLYLLSVAYHRLLWKLDCTAASLRYNNLLATLILALVASQCRSLIEARNAERQDRRAASQKLTSTTSFYAFHTGINIALLPVIFFFSGLYYTDVVSTLVVLIAYRNHLLRLGSRPPSLVRDVWTVVLGVGALFMRQTNVFWVVVYMGGVEAVHSLRSVRPAAEDQQPWFLVNIHDPSIDRAGPEEWLFCLVSIAITALSNPAKILRQIWPHLTILSLFGAFVAWNGGVVLGDKSNHVATIHLAQMLYIWPLFAFFSLPLFLPTIFPLVTAPLRTTTSLITGTPNVPITTTRLLAVTVPYTLLIAAFSLVVVHFNTIIHPFTLADNRHFMFYIFRYTIRRSRTVRLALVLPYTLSRWLIWAQLAREGIPPAVAPTHPRPQTTPPPSKPITSSYSSAPPRLRARMEQQQQQQQQQAKQQPSHDTTIPQIQPPDLSLLTTTSGPPSTSPPLTSTVLIWLLATTLSLVTAPLVEPRYFILPWVFYRLLVPAWSPPPNVPSSSSPMIIQKTAAAARAVDLRLFLETAWFLVVNAATMYTFLARPFYWRGEDGSLADGGRVQRFMW